MFQLDSLNQLFSNAPATDRNVLADIYPNSDLALLSRASIFRSQVQPGNEK